MALCFDLVAYSIFAYMVLLGWQLITTSPETQTINKIYTENLLKIDTQRLDLLSKVNSQRATEEELRQLEKYTQIINQIKTFDRESNEITLETRQFWKNIEKECLAKNIGSCFEKVKSYQLNLKLTSDIVDIIVVVLYFTLPTWLFGVTAGKKVMNIYVTSFKNGYNLYSLNTNSRQVDTTVKVDANLSFWKLQSNISFWQALARDIPLISFLIIALIYRVNQNPFFFYLNLILTLTYLTSSISAIFDPNKQSLYDKIAQTQVLQSIRDNQLLTQIGKKLRVFKQNHL